jgi:hypothetical protein
MNAGARCGLSVSGLFLAASLSLACSAVSIRATRNPTFPGAIPPPHVIVIVEGRPGPQYSLPLEKYLNRELQKNGISPAIRILTDADYNEDQVIKSLAQTANGLTLIVPTGGTTYLGTYKEILYDVRVFSITKGVEPKLTAVWRGRVDTTSGAFGFQVDARLEKFAMDLVGRLIGDGVLAGTAGGAGPANETRPAAGGPSAAAEPMTYGGGDGTSCAQAILVHAHSEMAGGRAEYDWIGVRYPGYQREMQALIRCNDRPADKLRIRTADGQEVEIFFDISEFFGQR